MVVGDTMCLGTEKKMPSTYYTIATDKKNLIPVCLMEKENNKMHVLCISPLVDYYAHTILYCFPIKSDQAHIRSMCLPSLDYTIKASSAQLAKITWQN